MRHRVPDAGSVPCRSGRRRLLQAALAGLLCPSWKALAAEPGVLAPAAIYTGGRILRRVDPQGMPSPGPDSFGPMTLFVFPVAVSAGSSDIYIADAGLGVVFRFDPLLDAMAVVGGVRATPQTRVTALQDGSVVVAEGNAGPPRRFSRSGRLLQSFAPENTGSRFDAFVVDPASGRYFGLDRVQHRVEEVLPLGRTGAVLAEDLLPRLPTAIAMDNQILYAAGQDCRCVVAVDVYRRDKHILVEDVTQVTALAAGEGWLVVADNVERGLRIYKDNVLRGDPGYDSLKLLNPQSLAIARGMLYVADAGSRRIVTFRLRP